MAKYSLCTFLRAWNASPNKDEVFHTFRFIQLVVVVVLSWGKNGSLVWSLTVPYSFNVRELVDNIVDNKTNDFKALDSWVLVYKV